MSKAVRFRAQKTFGCKHHMQINGQVCILGFINQASLPRHPVSLMAVDGRLASGMKRKLMEWVPDLVEIPPSKSILPAVSGHPDMQLVHVRENILVCHPEFPEPIIGKLRDRGFDIYIGAAALKEEYPLDIAYNAAIVGRVAFHNSKYTDEVLKNMLERCSIRLIHVNQGYSACSVLPVTPDSLITADPSIAEAAIREGMDVLKIPPQVKICLPGMNYGFIGGTAGFVRENTLAFTGELEVLDSGDEIQCFLKKHGVRHINLGKNRMDDYGGLLPLYEAGQGSF